MADLVSVHAFVYGRVQGTYFRAFTSRKAAELGIKGYARNMPDGTVEVMAEGERKDLDRLIAYLNIGPPAATVENIVTKWSAQSGRYSDFTIKY
ncbi:MAG: acylphosphatase [Dehalococcoidales bacterium]|nr:acylphosphatase [Dehalococcoidales bacterium]